MKKKMMAHLIASTLALCTVSCMQENPVERTSPNAGNTPNELTAAARTPIGSTEPITMISTLAQLRAMSTTGNYKLANNIDASPTAATPFVPIGFTKSPFTGTFDGNNFTISNLKIVGTWGNTGMFSWAVNAVIKNTRLTNVNVTGGANTGAIAGYARNIDLTNSYVQGGTVNGNVNDQSKLGMAIGYAGEFVRVSRCYATGTVNGWGRFVGGFIGYIYAAGTHDPNDDFRVSLDEVFTNVTVNPSMPASGSVYAGGLVGFVTGGSFQNVHTAGAVTGRNAAGGLLGYVVNTDPNSKPAILRGAMSRGIVTDATVAGRAGTIGNSEGTFAWCSSFWDKTTDTGVPNPNMPEPWCQTGKFQSELRNPHPSPNKLIDPYHFGMLITQQMIDQEGRPQCTLGSGSDGDWGFGTCGTTAIWALNSNTEYNTLLRIPNPSIQPKQ